LASEWWEEDDFNVSDKSTKNEDENYFTASEGTVNQAATTPGFQPSPEQQSLPLPATLIMKKPGEVKTSKNLLNNSNANNPIKQDMSYCKKSDDLDQQGIEQKNSDISNEEQMGSSND
jgi:hypothetical protein